MNLAESHKHPLWLTGSHFELEMALNEIGYEVDNNATQAEKEFSELPGRLKHSDLALHNQENNRYPGINYLVENHVIGLTGGKQLPASTIVFERRRYIATQAPHAKFLDDFWQMVIEQQCPVIINLVHKHEMLLSNQASNDRLEKYWPTVKTTMQLSNGLLVTTTRETQTGPISERHFQLIHPSGKKHEVVQIHYTDWEDGTKIELPQLIELIRRVHSLMKAHPTSPIVIHCRLGIGRTGTFIATHYLLTSAQTQLSTRDIVVTLRQQRRGMVASFDQYQVICAIERLRSMVSANH